MNPALKIPILFGGNRPKLDLNFLNGIIDSRITSSGGAGGTVVNASGVITAASAPRFDYNPTTHAALGVLVEEQRTNRSLWSADLTNAAWNLDTQASGITRTANAATAPDGNNAATKITLNAGKNATTAYIGQSNSTNPSVSTFYMKAAEYHYGVLGIGSFAGGFFAIFDLQAGTVATAPTAANTTASIAQASNGYWRCQIASSNASVGAQVITASPDNTTTTTGAGGSGIYAWSADLETSTFASSPITTTSAQVTRTADVVSLTGSNFSAVWGAVQGTVAATFDVGATTGTRPIVSFDDGTANNQIRLYVSGTSLKLTVTTGGVQQADLTLGTVSAGTQYNAAFSYTAGAFNAQMTGGTLQIASSGTVPTVTQMRIGADQAGNYQDGHAARVRLWQRPLAVGSLV